MVCLPKVVLVSSSSDIHIPAISYTYTYTKNKHTSIHIHIHIHTGILPDRWFVLGWSIIWRKCQSSHNPLAFKAVLSSRFKFTSPRIRPVKRQIGNKISLPNKTHTNNVAKYTEKHIFQMAKIWANIRKQCSKLLQVQVMVNSSKIWEAITAILA